MLKQSILTHLERNKLIAVIRDNNAINAYKSAIAAINGGINTIEVTMNTAEAPELLKRLREEHPNIMLGAGTVTTKRIAKVAISCGAKFIVSPNTNKKVIEHCSTENVVVVPGALTPTEIVKAYKLGADIVKVFPVCCVGGATYIKNIREPLAHIRLMPTGGIGLENIDEYIKAGVWTLGISSGLFKRELVDTGKFDEIELLAKKLLAQVSS